MYETGDDNRYDGKDRERDEGVNLEEGGHDGCRCCPEQHVGCKEQQSLQVVELFGRPLMVFVWIVTIKVCMKAPL